MQLYEFSLFFVLTRLVFPIKHCSVKLLKMEQPFCSQLFFFQASISLATMTAQ